MSIKKEIIIFEVAPNKIPPELANIPNINASNIIKIASSNNRCIILMNDGTLYEWGVFKDWPRDQKTKAPTLKNVTDIAMSLYNSFALLNDGTVVWWGVTNTNINSLANYQDAFKILTDIKTIAVSRDIICVVTNDGKLKGFGAYNLTSYPTDLPPVKSVSIAGLTTIVILNDNTIRILGDDTINSNLGFNKNPPSLNNVIAIAGNETQIIGLKNNNTAYIWGEGGSSVTPYIKNISAGYNFVTMVNFKETSKINIEKNNGDILSLSSRTPTLIASGNHVIAVRNYIEEPVKSSNISLYIGIGVSVLCTLSIIIIIIFVIKSKNKSKNKIDYNDSDNN